MMVDDYLLSNKDELNDKEIGIYIKKGHCKFYQLAFRFKKVDLGDFISTLGINVACGKIIKTDSWDGNVQITIEMAESYDTNWKGD